MTTVMGTRIHALENVALAIDLAGCRSSSRVKGVGQTIAEDPCEGSERGLAPSCVLASKWQRACSKRVVGGEGCQVVITHQLFRTMDMGSGAICQPPQPQKHQLHWTFPSPNSFAASAPRLTHTGHLAQRSLLSRYIFGNFFSLFAKNSAKSFFNHGELFGKDFRLQSSWLVAPLCELVCASHLFCVLTPWLPDLKNTSDDAIPNYLNSLNFTQSHFLTDVRLGLGYSAFAIAAACFAWDYQLGFESTKYFTAAAVALYTLVNGALTLWITFREKGIIYEGVTPTGEKVCISSSFEPAVSL